MGRSVNDDKRPVVVWFRDDLRLADNPALTAAARSGRPVIALFVLDEPSPRRPLGAAARWWLHQSLSVLKSDLYERGVPLVLHAGPADEAVPGAVRATGAVEVHWNRRYEAAARAVDAALRSRLQAEGIAVASHDGHLLVEPWTVRTKAGDWFKVFTPFWKASRPFLSALQPALPSPKLTPAERPDFGVPLESLGLEPAVDWAGGLRATWTPGEAGALDRAEDFLDRRLAGYADQRDIPGVEGTSGLSPHLRFGEISARSLYRAAAHRADSQPGHAGAVDRFQAELGWRDFSYNLLFHFPDLARKNFQPRFDGFPWRDDTRAAQDIAAWKAGRTGYPIVDAGMRQLWRTGVMHNRVRMVVASFLVKHLLIDWRVGEAWFWDTLCDADPANNPASWQWVAGSGADTAPYFRIFNPISQGERFDPAGEYVRRYVPELAHLPARQIHRPWTAARPLDYPPPIVDHDAARRRALAAFEQLKPRAA